MTIDTAATDHLLSTTRAVRRRLDLDRPVEKSVILDCLRLAVQAPTASNAQTWRWVVVTDPDKKAELARIYMEGGGAYLKAAAASATDPQTRRVYESAVYLSEILGRVPVHVIPCIEGRVDNAPNARGRVHVRLDHPGGVELHAGLAEPGTRIGLDHASLVQGKGGGRAARHPR